MPRYLIHLILQEFNKFKNKEILNGVYGLQLPIDADELNETICELKELPSLHGDRAKVGPSY